MSTEEAKEIQENIISSMKHDMDTALQLSEEVIKELNKPQQ